MKYALYFLLALLASAAVLLLVCVVRALSAKKTEDKAAAAVSFTKAEEEKYAEKISEMIKIPTVSKKKGEGYPEFLRLQQIMAKLYPLVFSKLEKHDFDGNLLRVWRGKNPARPAVLLMGHQDVVPAAEKEWKHEPFSGTIENGVIHGRGAMDCKSTLSCELNAIEELLCENFEPDFDIWLFSSVNEEINGGGAEDAAKWLKEHKVRLGAVLDEGGAIVSNIFPGLEKPCAAVGIVEKGHCNIKFTAKSRGGHSSTPPKNAPIERLAKFIAEVEKKQPFKKKLVSPLPEMFAALAPFLPFSFRVIMCNMWLFKGLLASLLPVFSPMAAAFVRTTHVFTAAKGSEAFNVIPDEAYVVCNIRPSLHQNSEESIAALKKIADKYDIETQVLSSRDASAAAMPAGAEFKYMEKCIKECLPDTVPIPYLMTGGTDCRYFESVCDSCLRFTPTRLSSEQLAAMHAANESVNAASLAEGVKFYKYYLTHRNTTER